MQKKNFTYKFYIYFFSSFYHYDVVGDETFVPETVVIRTKGGFRVYSEPSPLFPVKTCVFICLIKFLIYYIILIIP